MNSKAIRRTIRKFGPPVLAAASVIGTMVTGYLAAKAGMKSAALLKEAEDAKGEPLTTGEKIKAIGKEYVPAVAVGAATTASIIGGYAIGKRINAGLSAGYLALHEKYKQYQEEVKEEYGEEAHEKILERMAKPGAEKAEEVPITCECLGSRCNLDFQAVDEERTFLDAWSGKYFTSTINRVMAAEAHLNRNFILGGDISLECWYEFLGIEVPEEAKKDFFGWTIEDELYWIDFNHYKMITDDGFEAYVIEFAWDPYPNPYLTE